MAQSPTLLLFDIDGTLVLTGGAGGRAMACAFREVFGTTDFRSVSMAGRTDRWIIERLAEANGVTLDVSALNRIRRRYVEHLAREIQQPGPSKGVLPGVTALLDALACRDDVHLGLLTGNAKEGARIKLEHFCLWHYFAGGGFGDEATDRAALVEHALSTIAAREGTRYEPDRTIIIGDTTFDVAAARACGTRSLAVATGGHDARMLREAGADVVLPTLSDVQVVVTALGLSGGADNRGGRRGKRQGS